MLLCYPLSPSALLHLQDTFDHHRPSPLTLTLRRKTQRDVIFLDVLSFPARRVVVNFPPIDCPAKGSRKSIHIEQKTKPESVWITTWRYHITHQQKPSHKGEHGTEENTEVSQQPSKRRIHHISDIPCGPESSKPIAIRLVIPYWVCKLHTCLLQLVVPSKQHEYLG